MEFFDKLRNSLSASPLRNSPSSPCSNAASIESLNTWKLCLPAFTPNNIRLLLFRDCDRRGRKCLYDSRHVLRDENGKFSYIPATSKSEMKFISEYIFGSVPLSNNNTKRYHKFDGKCIWSQVFCPKKCRYSSNVSESAASTTSSEQSEAASEPIPQNRGNNLSLPNISSSNPGNIKSCQSLPSHLELQKTLLGLAIVIESNTENREMLTSYLQSISTVIEDCTDWFAKVASKAYCCPTTFVQTLYDFSQQFKSLIYSRLVTPMISTIEISSNWKALPAITKELINLLLRLDRGICKTGERVKLVLVGSSKKASEVNCLLYLFKILLLQCNDELGLDATTVCRNTSPKREETRLLSSQKQRCSFFSKSFSQEMCPIRAKCISSTMKVQIPKCESESMQKRDYDSGIDLSFSSSSVRSMKRSSSQKFDSSCGSPSFDSQSIFSYHGSQCDSQPSESETEEVRFRLGEESDADQSINTLALSDPHPEKLTRSISKRKEAFIEPVQEQIENLSLEPIQVTLDFTSTIGQSPVAHHVNSYCQFCDSLVTLDKFSPFYYVQWVRNSELSEDSLNLMQTFTSSKFLVINLERNCLRPVNFDIPCSKEMISSNFVTKLVDNIQLLTAESRENEIEQFLNLQLDSIQKAAQEFVTRAKAGVSCAIPSEQAKDANLIYYMAKLKCPNLYENS